MDHGHVDPQSADDLSHGFGFLAHRFAKHHAQVFAHNSQHDAGYSAAGSHIENGLTFAQISGNRQAIDEVAVDEFVEIRMPGEV